MKRVPQFREQEEYRSRHYKTVQYKDVISKYLAHYVIKVSRHTRAKKEPVHQGQLMIPTDFVMKLS